MEFKERLEKPSIDNKYYISTEKGGYNKCIIRDKETGNVLPNCVGYSYGRFMECQNIQSCTLSRGNAEDWYNYNDGYKRGKTPKLGAVACWKSGKTKNSSDGCGHVCNVERIYSDGSILVSESNYSGTLENGRYFKTMVIGKSYKLNNKTFQGFIYPDVNFEDEWETGKYKLLADKAIRKTPKITATNIVKAKNCTEVTKKHLASQTGNAMLRTGTIITCKEIVKDGNRLFSNYGNCWICIRNKDLTPQAIKID